MPTVFIKHKVKSYETWRPVYDRHAVKRADAGLTELGVFRDAKDPSELLVAFNARDLDKVRAFVASADLQTTMKEAGVLGEPRIWFAD